MLFNSLEFAKFLLVLVPLYFLAPGPVRPALLAVASYRFYMYVHPEWGWVLFGCTAIAYLSGLALERCGSLLQRRAVLAVAVAANVGVLIYFKYADLLISSFNQAAKTDFPLLEVVLPVGISFFTFQALSYVVDVYHGHFPAERRFDIFAAYKAFFPQLVAGPIERPGNVIPQLRKVQAWDWERTFSGLQLMLWGLFKKLVIADRLAVLVKDTYGNVHAHSGLQLLMATYAFAFQIFCDFSAYTDLARGCARIFGIELMENFRSPYFARSVQEFWSRWHISLSTWFRDYLYIPMGGSRVPALRWYFNIMTVFLVSGIWHGASWKFAIWGGLHGAYLLAGAALAKLTSKHYPHLKIAGHPERSGRVERGPESKDPVKLQDGCVSSSTRCLRLERQTGNRVPTSPEPSTGSFDSGPRSTRPSAQDDPRKRALQDLWVMLRPTWRTPWRAPLWLENGVKIFVTFHLVVLAWVFFRAESTAQAFAILGRIAKQPFQGPAFPASFERNDLLIAAAALLVLALVDGLHLKTNARQWLADRPLWVRWPVYYALIFSVLFFTKPGAKEFIYFQF